MLFRVQCVDKFSGAQSDRIYRAESADRAAEMAMREGFIVGHVFPEPNTAAAPAEGEGGRLESYGRKPARPRGEFVSFMMFESFVFPSLIRVLFALSLIAAIIATVAMPIVWLTQAELRTREGALLTLWAVASAWGTVVVFRLVAELWIVMFSVYDRLRELSEGAREK